MEPRGIIPEMSYWQTLLQRIITAGSLDRLEDHAIHSDLKEANNSCIIANWVEGPGQKTRSWLGPVPAVEAVSGVASCGVFPVV